MNKSAFILILLILLIRTSVMQEVPTPNFPIGLTLEYENEDEYFSLGTIYTIESFEVMNWLTPDNSSFQVRYNQDGFTHPEIWNVSYPAWDYSYYDAEINETIDGHMYPLWLDVSSWIINQNVNISFGTYITRLYTIKGTERIVVNDVPIDCWNAEVKFTDANDWDYTLRRYYDIQYGVLIKSYVHRFPDFDDYQNIGTFTRTLISSNILHILRAPSAQFLGINLTELLVLGITIEVIIIFAILVKRQK
nr:MAG: hypothetical protein AM325_14500 [Candidatus Thorarchaeota archaeon SMTZ1-45]